MTRRFRQCAFGPVCLGQGNRQTERGSERDIHIVREKEGVYISTHEEEEFPHSYFVFSSSRSEQGD